jgi:hypothetical protein
MRKKGYIFTDEHRKKISEAGKKREKDPNVEVRRREARHKICKNCNVEFCSITPTGYRTPKIVCCTKECASSLMTDKRKSNNSYARTEEAKRKEFETRKSKNPKHGEAKKALLEQQQKRGLSGYDKTKYSHWTKTPDGKQFLSNKFKGRVVGKAPRMFHSQRMKQLIKDNPSAIYSRTNGGIREDLGNVYFRSNWEANYARILNEMNISWEFEKHTFDLSNGMTYTPDFKISDTKFVEIKGIMDETSKEKIHLFLLEYPQYELDLIDEEKYRTLRNLFKHKISNWEGK